MISGHLLFIRNSNLNSHFLVGGSEQLLNSSTSSPSPSPTMIRYGITKPILLAGPTEADLLRNAELGRYLVNSGLYESKEEGEKREDVLNRIHEPKAPVVPQVTGSKTLFAR